MAFLTKISSKTFPTKFFHRTFPQNFFFSQPEYLSFAQFSWFSCVSSTILSLQPQLDSFTAARTQHLQQRHRKQQVELGDLTMRTKHLHFFKCKVYFQGQSPRQTTLKTTQTASMRQRRFKWSQDLPCSWNSQPLTLSTNPHVLMTT